MGKCSISLLERFWAKVLVQGGDLCWLWQGSCDRDGYGRFTKDGCTITASVMAYEFAYGGVPEGMWVLHRCDNPPCVRPSHLFFGTARDNSRDMISKGRGRSLQGELNGGGAKMTSQKVITMRAQYATGRFTFVHLGRLYGISEITAARICKRQNWKHVT